MNSKKSIARRNAGMHHNTWTRFVASLNKSSRRKTQSPADYYSHCAVMALLPLQATLRQEQC